MPVLSDAERRQIFEEMRQQERANRRRKRPDYITISVAEARRAGYRPVTSAYSTRQFDQCAMLDHVIKDFANCDIKLVRVGVRKNCIEVWRKVWDRQLPPPKVQRVRQNEIKTFNGTGPSQELCDFMGKLIGSILS